MKELIESLNEIEKGVRKAKNSVQTKLYFAELQDLIDERKYGKEEEE